MKCILPRLSTFALALFVAILFSPHNGKAESPMNHENPVIGGETPQPTMIPGAWKWESAPLPPLAEILKTAKPNPSIYGVYTWACEYSKLRESIRKVGWKAIRCGGPLDDVAMQAFAEDGIELMYTFCLPPHKADATPEEDEAFIQGYAKKITEIVARYGPGGKFFKENKKCPNNPLLHVEICNEPNFQYMVSPGTRPLAELETIREKLYSKLLPAGYSAVKRAAPTVNVIGFAAGGASAADIRFIENTHNDNRAVAKSYDVLSTHPYVEPAPPEEHLIQSWGSFGMASALGKIRDTLTKNGRNGTPIWYTEVGWPISQKDGGFFAMSGTQVTPELQAAYVCRGYAYAQRLGISRVHVMFLTDTDNFNGGFFLQNGTWRPSATAVKNMIDLMPSPRLIDVLSDGKDGYFAYKFSPTASREASPVLMIWNVGGPKTVTLPWDAPAVTVTDMFGHAKRLMNTGHELRVEIGPLPLYLQADGSANIKR